MRLVIAIGFFVLLGFLFVKSPLLAGALWCGLFVFMGISDFGKADELENPVGKQNAKIMAIIWFVIGVLGLVGLACLPGH